MCIKWYHLLTRKEGKSMEQYQTLWNQTKEKLKEAYDEEAYMSTFNDINKVIKVSNGVVYILCPSPLIKTKIEKFYSNNIQKIVSSISNQTIRLKFVTEEQITEASKPTTVNLPDEGFQSNLNASYSFDSFVVGESNKFAFRIATQVSNPDQGVFIANPLYIFGGVGLGKTHLMQAIGNAILDNDPSKKVLFIPATTYISDYTKASHQAKRLLLDDEGDTVDAYTKFHQKYDNLDVLLVDDIQLLKGAQKSQAEFFKLFNQMHDNNKLIVITSDKPADQLDIMERLTTRFNWGMAVDIKLPDLEHRVKILKRKLSDSYDSIIGDDVLKYIAATFPNNIRDLESTLNRVINMAICEEKEIDLDFAKKAIEPLIKTRQNGGTGDEYENLKSIVADFYKISIDDLIGSKRQALYVDARHICMYILKNKYNLPYKKIGTLLGGRDHTTVIAAVEKVSHNKDRDEKTKMAIDYILKKMR